MAAGSIVIDLLMKTGLFETDVKRAEKALKNFEVSAGTLGKTLKYISGAIGLGAFGLLVKSTIDAADATGKLAQQAGVAVEELSGLTYAASLADISQEELGASLVKLTKNMSEAAAGNKEAAKGFDALGISVKNADGTLKSSDKVLSDVAQKFAGMEDGAEKTALALALFGKAGAQLIPLLNAGAGGLEAMKKEAAALGVVISGDLAKSAEDFNDNLTRMGAAIKGLVTRGIEPMLPMLTEVSQAFIDLAKDQNTVAMATSLMRGTMDAAIVIFQTMAVLGSDVAFVFRQVGEGIGATIAGYEALARFDLKGFNAISEAVKADGIKARAELDAFQARVMAIGLKKPHSAFADNPFQAVDSFTPKKAAPRITDTNKDKVSEAQRYLEALQRSAEKARDLTAVEEALDRVQNDRLDGLTPKLREQIMLAAQQVDMAKATKSRLEAQKKQEEERLDFIKKGLEEEMRLRGEISQLSKQAADAHAAEIEQLIKGNEALRDEAAILAGGEDARKAIEKARLSSTIALKEETLAMLQNAGASDEQIQALEQEIRLLKERADLLGQRNAAATKKEEQDAAKDRSKALADSIEEGILEGARRGHDIMEIFRDELKAQFAKTVLRPIIEPVAGAINQVIAEIVAAISKGISGGGAGAGASAGALAVDAFFAGGGFAGPMAGGGTIRPGQFALVGENGPELWSAPGTITPLDYSPAQSNAPAPMGGGAPVFNLKIETRPGETAEVTRSRNQSGGQDVLVRMVEKTVEQKFSGDMATGGPIARTLQNTTGVSRAPMLVR